MNTPNADPDDDGYHVERFCELTDPPLSLDVDVVDGALQNRAGPLTVALTLTNQTEEKVAFSDRREAQFVGRTDSRDNPQFVLWPDEWLEIDEDVSSTSDGCGIAIHSESRPLVNEWEWIEAQTTYERRLCLISVGGKRDERGWIPTCPTEIPKAAEFEAEVLVRSGDFHERRDLDANDAGDFDLDVSYQWGFRIEFPPG